MPCTKPGGGERPKVPEVVRFRMVGLQEVVRFRMVGLRLPLRAPAVPWDVTSRYDSSRPEMPQSPFSPVSAGVGCGWCAGALGGGWVAS